MLLLADLVCLVLDLGNPLRFHHMLRVFKPSSPMSLGTWCLTAFSMFLTVLVVLDVVVAVGWLSGDSGAAWWIRKLTVAGGLPFAFGSAAYKGVLFSTSAQPGWKDARWLAAYLVNSAVGLGAGTLLLIATLTGEARATSILHPAVGLLVALNAAMRRAPRCRTLASLVVAAFPPARARAMAAPFLTGIRWRCGAATRRRPRDRVRRGRCDCVGESCGLASPLVGCRTPQSRKRRRLMF